MKKKFFTTPLLTWISVGFASVCGLSNTFAQSTSLYLPDTRNTPTLPGDYRQSLAGAFKFGPVVGLPNIGHEYYTLLGLRGWVDDTGGVAHELAFSNNKGIYYRTGTEASGWLNWRKILSEDFQGNVGIGTETPSAKLHVGGGGISVNGANTVTGVNGFRNFIQLVDDQHAAILYNPGQSNQLMFGFHSNGNMYWGSKTNYSMILENTGNLYVVNSLTVGGGLKSGSKMSVNGKFSATEVEVTTSNWPDYVFEESYNLPSLQETERFIKMHKHLPNVPAAQEVETNGIALGAMNSLLLQKIEELTLHLIEKDKEIDQLKKQTDDNEKWKMKIESAIEKLSSSK